MQRPQKTAKVGYPCEGMLETDSNKGACSVAQLETERQDGAENLLEAILVRNNLNKAYLKVKRNGDTAENNGNYFKNNVVETSAHYFVDDTTVVRSVADKILLGMQATGILIAVQSELKLQAQLQNAQARHLKM